MSDYRYAEAVKLFRDSIAEIDAALNSKTRHELMRAALPFRQLFIDSYPLVHRINRKHRIPLFFYATKSTFEKFVPQNEDGTPLILGLKTTSGFPGDEQVGVKLEKLLSAECLYYDNRLDGGVTYTVIDVVKACAYIKGGIHFNEPSKLSEDLILELDESCEIMGHEPSIYVTAGVMDTFVRGCLPLVRAVGMDIQWQRCSERFANWITSIAFHAMPKSQRTDREVPLITNWKVERA